MAQHEASVSVIEAIIQPIVQRPDNVRFDTNATRVPPEGGYAVTLNAVNNGTLFDRRTQ